MTKESALRKWLYDFAGLYEAVLINGLVLLTRPLWLAGYYLVMVYLTNGDWLGVAHTTLDIMISLLLGSVLAGYYCAAHEKCHGNFVTVSKQFGHDFAKIWSMFR